MNTILQDGIFLKTVGNEDLSDELAALAEEFPDSKFVTMFDLNSEISVLDLSIDEIPVEELHLDTVTELDQINTNFTQETFVQK